MNVTQGAYSLGIITHVATNAPAAWPVAFAVMPTVTNYSGTIGFNWSFGDGSPASTNQFPTHTYTTAGKYTWTVTATAGSATVRATGNIAITQPVSLAAAPAIASHQLSLTQPPGMVLEQSATLGSSAVWTPVTNPPTVNGVIVVPASTGSRFYRVRQAW